MTKTMGRRNLRELKSQIPWLFLNHFKASFTELPTLTKPNPNDS